MRSTTSTPTANLSTTSAASTSPNAAVTRGGSPPGADDAESRSSSHSDTEGGQKPSLTSKIATTPSLPELVPPQPDAQLKKSITALVDMLLHMQDDEARQTGKELQGSWKDCVRNGLHGHELRGIQDICLNLLALSGRRQGLGLGKAEQDQFDQLVDDVFHASNNADATLPEDHGTSRKEKDDEETPSKKRVKRKVRSGEAPGSGGADKKKSRKSEVDISIPKLTSPYPPNATTTTGNSRTSSTSTATTSTALGASSSHSASTDSPPLSPRRGLDVAASVSPTGLNADSASLLGRIERNLSTLATQFETLCEFGLAIVRSDWSGIQEAREIVMPLLEPGGQPASQFGRANELDKLSRAIKSLNTALQSSRESAVKLKHPDFLQEDFLILARRMAKLLESIQVKLSTLQITDEQLKSPGGATGANPGDAVTRLRSPSGRAKAPPSLSTFGRRAGKSAFTSSGPDSLTPAQGDAPLSPRSARRSMLVSVPVAHLKMTTQGALTATTTTTTTGTTTTTTTANVASSASPRPVSTLMAPPTVTPAAPLSPPTSPRVALKPQPQPLRLRGGPTPRSNAGATDQSIATLKAALGKYSMRNLMHGFAIEGSSVVPTGPASSTTSAAIAPMPPPVIVGSAVQPLADLRALLSGSSARNLLQRFRIDGDNVVVSSEAQTPAVVSNLPTQGSGDLSDADIAELVKKVESGDDNLLQSLIQSLEEALVEPALEQSIDDTVILTSSSDESDLSQ